MVNFAPEWVAGFTGICNRYNYQRLHDGIYHHSPADVFYERDKQLLNERMMKILVAR